jgi:hypothetical protein
MKLTRAFTFASTILLASSTHLIAIEGLKIAVRCPDVILGWPSAAGETYIVQYRPTLDDSASWLMLTNSLPATDNTNWTVFVHSNQVQCPAFGSMSLPSISAQTSLPPVPLAFPVDGSGSPAPLNIYPPGFDLSGFIILDPQTGESINGAGWFTAHPNSSNPIDPPGGLGGESEGPIPPAQTGFYEVVRVGVHAAPGAITNTPASGTVSLPFEAGSDTGTLQDVTALVDGVRYGGATPLISPNIAGAIQIDTTFLGNGDHYIQVEANWLDLNAADPNGAFIHQVSQPFSLTVSNSISFPDWVEEIGELGSTLYTATTVTTNADWYIDIYDVRSNLVQSLAGHTTDGTIEAYWDLTDINGDSRTNSDLDPEFDSTIAVAGYAPRRTPRKKPAVTYPEHARWAISYQETFRQMVNSNGYYQAIYDMGSLGADFGGAVSIFPSGPTNGQAFPLRFPSTNYPVPIATMLIDQHALERLLTNNLNRNFYYNGHSSDQVFGGFLNANYLSFILRERGHYYRFAFLDSCSSANGGLPAAFGINFNSQLPYSYFQKHKIRPRAFLGYPTAVHYCYSGNYTDPTTGQPAYGLVPASVYEFLNNFEFYWYFNYDLSSAIYYAVQDTPYIGPNWQTGDTVQLYGYSLLGVDDFNWNYQWSN